MSNFGITFLYPWLLLLLVPAAIIAGFFYFRLSKKYRFTRNRVLSIVLFLMIMTLSISILSGINISYAKPNVTNEIILLVDVSFSNQEAQLRKNDFVKKTLENSDSSFKMGIVIFAKEQKYVSKLSYDMDEVFNQYIKALDDKDFDDSSTDIASAFNFIIEEKIFSKPESGKIVLISDGIETDKNSLSNVVNLAINKIKVDTVFFPNNYGDELLIHSIETPNYNVLENETINIDVVVQSSYSGAAFFTLYDNGSPTDMPDVNLKGGLEKISFSYMFKEAGAHELCFVVKSGKDTILQNNAYYAYVYLDTYDRILIIDKENESTILENVLKQNYPQHEKDSKVKVVKIDDDELPNTVEGLRDYDVIILMNISNKDMPQGFASLLQSYVKDYGGGLLTVGGNIDGEFDMYGNPVANAYNREFMAGTIYQSLLPIDCVDYTPPLALVLVIDRSGSMGSVDNQKESRMELAKKGATACVNALNDRDFVGIVSFNGKYTIDLQLTPLTQRGLIADKIKSIKEDGGTQYTNAIDQAGQMLKGISNVEKRHIIFVTDGEPSDDSEIYERLIKDYYNDSGITLSAVAIVSEDISSSSDTIKRMARIGHGQNPDEAQQEEYYYNVIDSGKLSDIMLSDLEAPQIRAVTNKEFNPEIRDRGISVTGLDFEKNSKGELVLDKDGKPKPIVMPELGGFYGSRLKKKTDDNNLECVLIGEASMGGPPIYAQWTADGGKGKVGSFMSDLNGGSWSNKFLNSDYGKLFIHNTIRALSPSESIRAQDMDVKFNHDNYQIEAEVKSKMDEGDKIKLTVKSPESQISLIENKRISLESQETVYWADLSVVSENSIPLAKCVYNVYQPGIYQITIERINQNGDVVGNPFIKMQAINYSKEYDTFVDTEENESLLMGIAAKGKGNLIKEPSEAFIAYEMFDEITYDPRVPFIIISIILFLLNIAVIKFKFKWPWEIVSDYKLRKSLRSERHGIKS